MSNTHESRVILIPCLALKQGAGRLPVFHMLDRAAVLPVTVLHTLWLLR